MFRSYDNWKTTESQEDGFCNSMCNCEKCKDARLEAEAEDEEAAEFASLEESLFGRETEVQILTADEEDRIWPPITEADIDAMFREEVALRQREVPGW